MLAEVLLEHLQRQISRIANGPHTKTLEDFSGHSTDAPKTSDWQWIEELLDTLREKYTVVIVTHNMAQARRASDECIFMLLGELIEHGATTQIFLKPAHEKTEMYIEGRYG